MKKILLGIIRIGFFSSLAYADIDVSGTWVKSCSYDPIPGEKKPNYSTITATLKQRHIDIEINYFTDSTCKSPWKLMPTFLQSGTYRVSDSMTRKRIGGKEVLVTPIHIHINRYDNHAKFASGKDFTVYYNPFGKVYLSLHNRLFTLHRAITEPKARLAEEVYKQKDDSHVCVISMKIRTSTISFCLENVSFPKEKFQAYCEASTPEDYGTLHYTYTCPSKLREASCLYGLQQLGHNLRRWYPKEELKTNPLAKKACIEQLHGAWNK